MSGNVISRPSSRTTSLGLALFALLALVVMLPNLMWLLVDHPASMSVQDVLLLGLATLGLLLSVSPRLWVGAVLLAPWAILAPFEGYYIADFGKPSDAHLMGIVGDTNVAEASAFMSGIIGELTLLSVFSVLLVALLVVLGRRNAWKWRGRSRYWVLLACCLALALPELAKIGGPVRSLPFEVKKPRALGAELADEHLPESFDYLRPVYPVGVFGRFYTYLQQRRDLKNAQGLIADFRFGASQQAAGNERQVFVLVIGEAGRPDRWQLNGYARETTPRLAKLDRVVSFSNAFSPWAWTRMSVPIIVSRKPGDNTNQFFAERSLVTAFREAGFRTYWFSTQSPQGPHDSSIALHASEAHETKFINPLDYKSAGVFDGALFAPLDDVLKRDEPRVLIVLHTLGSHFNYADRYPDEFDHFKPSLKGVRKPSLQDPALKEQFNNSYDNSQVYLDHFLAELIGRLSATNSVASMLYVADHGENLFDGDCDKAGHGRGNEYDFRVAALWWTSARYEQVFPDKAVALRARKDAPISTTNVFHSLLDAADIHYADEDLRLSMASASWQPAPRITQDKIDFDRAAREGSCKKLLPAAPLPR